MVVAVELGLFPGAAGRDVDGGEDPGFGQGAVEDKLAVARALELFEDELIHSRAGIDQARGDDGDRASLFDVPGQSEQAARDLQDTRFQTAAHGMPAWPPAADSVIKRPSQAREAVDHQDDFPAAFELGLHVGKHQFGEFDVFVGRVVAGAGHHFGALDGPAKMGHFLRPLIHQEHDDPGFRRTLPDRLDGLLQEDRLSRLGRRNNQLSRTLADRSDQVYDPHAFLAGTAQVESFVRIDGHQIREMGALTKIFRGHAPDGFDRYKFPFAFLSLGLSGDRGSFGELITLGQNRLDHQLALRRPIGPLGGPDGKLSFVDSFQYSSNRIGHQNTPWEFF